MDKVSILTNYIDQLFASLETSYPMFAGALASANSLLDSLAGQIVNQLGDVSVVLADEVFTVAIDVANNSGHPALGFLLQMVKNLIDSAGVQSLPKLKLA